MALPCCKRRPRGQRSGRRTAPRRQQKDFPAWWRHASCLLETLGLFLPWVYWGPLPTLSLPARGPVFSYSSSIAQPTFSLLSRCFAFRPSALFTGLLAPTFFQGLADHHNLD